MLPFSYEWSLEPGRLIFLGIFYTVLCVAITGVLVALWRSYRTFKTDKVDAIAWSSTFHDLPEASRTCRHEIAGRIEERTCHNGFDCRQCAGHAQLKMGEEEAAAGGVAEERPFGLNMPADRLYGRGHTWVEVEEDGTYRVGLDDLGSRLLGRADALILPEPGTRVDVNGAAWRAQRAGNEVRILSPVRGEIIDVGGPDGDWYLRVRPETPEQDLSHLLGGKEVRPWVARELERIQGALAGTQVGVTMADGGIPVEDLPKAAPDADWDVVWGDLFLEA